MSTGAGTIASLRLSQVPLLPSAAISARNSEPSVCSCCRERTMHSRSRGSARPASTSSYGLDAKQRMTKHLARMWHKTLRQVWTTKKPRTVGLGLFHGAGDDIELAL
ncbi:hypothetical protein GCM10018966_060730 [Streptomyces yanii]